MHRAFWPSVSQTRRLDRTRHGVVLLVMLSLLGLFTAIAMTFVIASGQFRRGAAAASRTEQIGDPYDVLLQQAMMQIARGSNHPQSVIGPHGLLEDMYGNSDAVVGQVYSGSGDDANNTQYTYWAGDFVKKPEMMLIRLCAISYGFDRKPGIAYVDDNHNKIIDDPAEALDPNSDDVYLGNTPVPLQLSANPANPAKLDDVDNYYAGRVITFITGPSSGQSCYIVRSKVEFTGNDHSLSGGHETVLMITPPDNNTHPQLNDEFVINGRAFSGTGIGATPYEYDGANQYKVVKKKPAFIAGGQPNRNLRMLDMPYAAYNDPNPSVSVPPVDSANTQYQLTGKVPMALTPNPTDFGFQNFLKSSPGLTTTTGSFWPMLDADEDYDAVDEQNMLLAYDSLGGEIIPSLHRPKLVQYFRNEVLPGPMSVSSTDTRWTSIPPSVRRRIILRPDPADHFDTRISGTGGSWIAYERLTIDLNGNGQYDSGDSYDDANGNGKFDGTPSFANVGFDAMNTPIVNPNGSLTYLNKWDVDNDGDGRLDSIWVDLGFPVTTASDGKLIKALAAIKVIELDGRINVNAHGSQGQYGVTDEVDYSVDPSKRLLTGLYTQTNPKAPFPTNYPQHQASGTDYATEERYFVGSYAWFRKVAIDNNSTNPLSASTGSDSLFNALIFPKYAMIQRSDEITPRADAYEQRWAVGYDANNLSVQAAADGNATTSWFYNYFNSVSLEKLPPIEAAVGQGYSVADVNIGGLFRDAGLLPVLGTAPLTTTPRITYTQGSSRNNPLRGLLEGSDPDPKGTGTTSVNEPGRYGEGHLVRSGRAYHPGVGIRPRPGVTNISTTTVANSSIYSGTNLAAAKYTGDDNQPGESGKQLGNSRRDTYPQSFGADGDFGTPGDQNSDGAVALDLAGRPMFLAMGGTDEVVDEPGEINLNRRYFPQYRMQGSMYNSGKYDGATDPTQLNDFGDIDAPYTPAEMERLLRYRDRSANALPSRLMNRIGDSRAVTMQDLLTTDSWDVPCPHIAPTPELAVALADLGLPATNPSIGDLLRARFYVAHGRSTGAWASLAGSPQLAAFASTLANLAMRSYSWFRPNGGPGDTYLCKMRNASRLLAPDLGTGLRMDLNAPFGNGVDDNNNNVIDEPAEELTLAGMKLPGNLWFDGNHDGYVDADNLTADPTGAAGNTNPENARQNYAKELYCLMMLLIDENYVTPLPNNLNGTEENLARAQFISVYGASLSKIPLMPYATGTTDDAKVQAYIYHWLTARRIAQWAVNVVDFRDRDSIMTYFEFDADPFFDNDGNTLTPNVMDVAFPYRGNGTWEVDGDATPAQDLSGNGIPYDDTLQPWRGIVWGCEYPDLLLMETVAFHDRRTQNYWDDTNTSTAITGSRRLAEYDFATNKPKSQIPETVGSMTLTDIDQTWDQTRVPQGSAFIELFATGNPNAANGLPAELYLNANASNTALPTMPVLALSKAVYSQTTGVYAPVWRLAITQGRKLGAADQVNNHVARRLAENPVTCSLDPADQGFSILPWVNASATPADSVVVERVVHFCGETRPQTGTNPAAPVTATFGLNLAFDYTANNYANFATGGSLAAPTMTIDVFHRAETYAADVYAYPGDYVVVGPHREGAGGYRDITTIGRSVPNTFYYSTASVNPITSTSYAQAEPLISLCNTSSAGFIATSPDGSDEYPQHSIAGSPTTSTVAYAPSSVLHNATMTRLGGMAKVVGLVPDYDQVRRPVMIACETKFSTGGLASTEGEVGLNISEPMNGRRSTIYPIYSSSTLTLKSVADAWNSGVKPEDFVYRISDSKYVGDDVPWDGFVDSSGGTTILNTQLPDIADHTTLLYKSVFLQRLADPTRPWDRFANPYICMDWMPFDLTVFNGEPWLDGNLETAHPNSVKDLKLGHFYEGGTGRLKDSDPTPPLDETTPQDTDKRVRFGSRQRGAPRFPYKGNYSYLDLWRQPDWYQFDGSKTINTHLDTRPPLTQKVSDCKDNMIDPSNIQAMVNVAARYNLGWYDDGYTAAAANPNGSSTDKYFNLRWQDPLQHTLGYINQGYHYRLRLRTYRPLTASANPTNDYLYRPNDRVGTPIVRPAPRAAGAASVFAACGWIMGIDFRDADFTQPGTYVDNNYLGMPWRPFNWLTWNNRPFASSGELMLVPAVGPARLLYEFDMRRPTKSDPTSLNPPLPQSDIGEYTGNHYLPAIPNQGSRQGYLHRPPYGHLLNFFESTSATADQNLSLATTTTSPYGNFYRLFELVTVPSRFSGTQKRHFHVVPNPGSAVDVSYSSADGIMRGPTQGMPENPSWPFCAPFNAISAYREPGRVNFNTMPNHQGIWTAVTNDFFPSSKPTGKDWVSWSTSQTTPANFTNLKNGMVDPQNGNVGAPTSQRPTSVVNPFRSYLSSYSAVVSDASYPTLKGAAMYKPQTGANKPYLAVDATLMRRMTLTDNTRPPTDNSTLATSVNINAESNDDYDPLFALNFPAPYSANSNSYTGYSGYLFYNWGRDAETDQSWFVDDSDPEQKVGTDFNYVSRGTDYRNSDRNAFFRYQLYTKLQNIATTRSNVYAIWVTIGYFEVERVKVDSLTSRSLPTQSEFPSDDIPDAYRYPDGYRLLREHGADSGETVRHKAFAILDRTIPVGFVRGENLNVDKAFLIRRVLY
jgi:hypothetical protein